MAAVALFVAILLAPPGARATDTENIRVLLSTAPGAPTPAQVMSWVNATHKISAPPLNAFTVKSPTAAYWLIPDRASGDFLTWLNTNSKSVRKKLEDYQLMTFAAADIPAALAALQADPYVLSASVASTYELSSVQLTDFEIAPSPDVEPIGGNDQYGWFDLNLDAAWQLAGGYGLIGVIDMGLNENHAALRQFSGGTFVGGNFVKAASKDIGLTGRPAQSGFNPADVDEKKSQWITDSGCTAAPALMPPAILGHGTHVAGLVGANEASGLDVQGTCKNCPLAMWKTSYLVCDLTTNPPQVEPQLNSNAAHRGEAQAVDGGAVALSASYGNFHNGQNWCQSHYLFPECLSIAYASSRQVAMTAASGNERAELNFPASDARVISAGGFEENLGFWDDWPNCPSALPSQCGSNRSVLHSGYYLTRQELLGSAKRVLSTTYPNTTWVDYGECGDGYGTPMGDGIGWCTGTSMSAPQIAGVVALLRSTSPLVPTGVPEPPVGTAPGLRTVLAQTALRAKAGLGWDPLLGYGIPDAAAAVRKMLGKVVNVTVRNRATPLFRLYDAATRDFAETTSPQYALSLMITQVHNYVQPVSGLGAEALVPGYTFPYDPNDPSEPDNDRDPFETGHAAPLAAIYVLTTEYRPRSEWPALVPLYLMDKTYPSGRDFMLVTTTAEIQAAYNSGTGYSLLGITGYLYQPCTPEPGCIPPGAQKLWREYKTADNDCAVFLDSEKGSFEANGYTAACPAGATKMIGYAYPSTDSDGDGLPNAFELTVGTNPNAADSDNDGTVDAVEFPMSGVPISDPCWGGTLGARNCGADVIFKNGFQLP